MPVDPEKLPAVLVTGFTAFPGAPVNPTAALIADICGDPGDLGQRCRLHGAVLDVDYGTIGDQLAAIGEAFCPDIALHFGLAADAEGFRLEKTGRNRADPARPDNAGCRPGGVIINDGPSGFDSRLPREEIAQALKAAGLPATLDDRAGDYLCNALFYLSRLGTCGRFGPQMSGFIHVPQWPVDDGGLPGEGARLSRADLLAGAIITIEVSIGKWWAGGSSPPA